jgi:hypothetical protein
MKKLMSMIGGVGCLALQACSAGSVEEAVPEGLSTEGAAASAEFFVYQEWGSGYCARLYINNGLSVAANNFKVNVDLKGSVLQNNSSGTGGKAIWGAAASGTTGKILLTPVSYTNTIQPGNRAEVNFCANGYNPNRPVLGHWNMTTTAYAPCSTNSGLNPMRAALAVAMGAELRRWKPEVDLQKGWDGKVSLSSTGLARCTNGCPNTKAILGQQDEGIRNFVDQNVFNPTVFMEDMKASFDRVKNKMDDLARNNPGALPVDHNLTLVGGPVNLGLGACGPHYIYQVTHANGSELTTSQAQNLSNALCFYGQGSCGANPYIGYVSSNIPGCPYGKKCVAIDPTDGDTSSTNTTTAGSAPTYPMNRVWNPDNSLLGTSCMTTTGKAGTLQSKCSSYPATCGYLYCIAP